MFSNVYIVSDPAVLGGKPVINGTRVSVELILELLNGGWTEEQVLEAYPGVTADALTAVHR